MHLFHRWTPWSDPEPGTTTTYVLGHNAGTRDVAVQQRTCAKCNKRQVREAQ